MFVGRFEEGAWYSKYVPTEEGVSIALIVGAMALIGFSLGAASVRRQGRSTKAGLAISHTKNVERIYFPAGFVVLAALGGTATYVVALTLFAGPGIFGQLRNGRSAEVNIGGTPEFVMFLPLTGAIAVALFMLGNKYRKLTRLEILIAVLAVTTSLALVSQLGNRRFIIPAVLIPVISALMRRPARIRLWHIVVSFVGVLLLAIIPMVRAAGARRPGENLLSASWRYLHEEGFSGVLRPVFVSYDTEMFDYIAIVAPGLDGSAYGWGRGSLLEFATRPLPESWNGNPAWSERLLTQLFGGGCGDPVCPVASLPGVLYFEGGFIVVLLGSVATGAFLRSLAVKWKYNGNITIGSQLCVVIISSFALVAVRTNTVHASWWILYSLLIALVLYSLAKAINGRGPGGHPSSVRHSRITDFASDSRIQHLSSH